MNSRVGGAFVVYNKGVEIFSHGFRLSDHDTVYSAERMAIDATIDFVIANHIPISSIISDSRSVLQALAMTFRPSPHPPSSPTQGRDKGYRRLYGLRGGALPPPCPVFSAKQKDRAAQKVFRLSNRHSLVNAGSN
ncbi:hypothetical protein CEXT_87211 [Caerostris extrusa]|uniref:RNase H type-1 domain-containing protein n=1 Tax=Caerostris extrusa TaxID=172846 RepID=A0AAV4TA99_CAEEX|nr:hypothetical protein CEXT_87211 [Caerostris extrusa]